MLTSLFSSVYDFVFGVKCAICKRDGSILCSTCVASLKPCLDIPHDATFVGFSYQDYRVRQLIHAFKYYHKKDIGVALTKVYAHTLESFVATLENPLLVPIPMYRARMYTRGHDHAAIIASTIGRPLSVPVEKRLLTRNKDTAQLSKTHSKSERAREIKNAFTVDISKIRLHHTIILVDDIITTGATMREAKRVLEKCGYKDIRCIALAH
jgi:ComF family protein